MDYEKIVEELNEVRKQVVMELNKIKILNETIMKSNNEIKLAIVQGEQYYKRLNLLEKIDKSNDTLFKINQDIKCLLLDNTSVSKPSSNDYLDQLINKIK